MYILPLSNNDYQTFPISTPAGDFLQGVIEITEEEYEGIKNHTKSFDPTLTHVVDFYKTPEEIQREQEFLLQEKRARRYQLLIAFDKYKTNVYYGIEQESQEDHNLILNWYHNLLDLSDEALENIPKRVKYYL